MKNAAEDVPRIPDYHDFTSPDNKYGLPMRVEVVTDRSIVSHFTIPDYMGGWRAEGVVGAHPGAVATVLATVMGQGSSYRAKRPAWIKSMSVEYLNLVPVGVPLKCEAKEDNMQKRGDRELLVDAIITDGKNQPLARARAEYHLFEIEELRAPQALIGSSLDSALMACAPALLEQFTQLNP